MSSRPSSGEPQNTSSTRQSSSPASGPTRSSPSKATQQDASVELKNMAPEGESVKGAIPLGEDIMQIARIGEVSVMHKLFDTKRFNASFKDDEGITPLHVCARL